MIKAILTDIEGTTSSISFVKDVLFPYASKHLPAFVQKHQNDPEVREQLEALWQEEPELEQNIEASIACLLDWIAQDQKRTPLKAFQGMLWKHGYQSGQYQAHIYPDAVSALKDWQAEGLALYVYSSGSISAQKLFFKYSEAGDLTSLFQGYFDTTSGPKQSAASYDNIQVAIGIPASDILFLSDIEAELDAAKASGMQTCWLTRPEDCTATVKDLAQSVHPRARSFAAIDPAAY